MENQNSQQEITSTPQVTSSQPKSNLLVVVVGVFFLTLFGIGGFYLGQRDQGTTNQVIPTDLVAPTTAVRQSSVPTETANWKIYDALKDGFVENEKGNFIFKYPPEFRLDHASGPARDFGSTSTIFRGEGMDLGVNTVNLSGSPHDQAEAFVNGILSKAPNSMNCDLLPSCNLDTFSIRDITMPNNISATVVSGPDTNNNVFDLYFIQNGLSFWFSYKDREKWEKTRDQIISTFKFLDQNDINQSDKKIHIACGCGCCAGVTPISQCLYHSKGDDLDKIIREDTAVKQSSQCSAIGCSRGIEYRYCD